MDVDGRAGVNIALNLWLIPLIGIQGAAAATFASCLIVFLIRLVNARRLLAFPLSGKKLALGVAALLIANPTDYSFPSGHTLSSVISAVILAKTDRRFGHAAIPLAVLIAFSRLYLYVHFPSNVLASAVLGIIIGHLIFRFGDSLLNKLKAPRLRAKS